jgi:putative FmdB family regulatory protein
MPIYEYRCEKGHTFDVMQSMSDDPLTACEVCGAPVQKVLHAPAVHFKGSGFYNTDYGKGGKSKSAGGSGGEPKKGSPDSNGSSGSSDSSSSSSSSDSGSSSKKSESKPGSSTKSD